MSAASLARRCAVVPIVLLLEAVLLAAAPVLVPVAAVLSLASRRRAPLRVTIAVLGYALTEFRALGELVTTRGGDIAEYDIAKYDAIVARFVARVDRMVRRVLGIRLVLTDDSIDGDDLPSTVPLVVLSRHAGPGDSLLVLALMSSRWRLRPRVVLRSALRLEPAVELVLSRVPTCFVSRRHPGRARRRVADVAATLAPGEALLIFPEGGNFSAERRRDRIALLRRRREYAAARRARRMRNVVAPHPGGVLAALTAAPNADVVVVAHEGLAPSGAGERPWWALPLDREVRACAWHVPREQIPTGDDAMEGWLLEQWEQVDAWVRAARSAPGQSFSIGA